jgi:hypothetical protein
MLEECVEYLEIAANALKQNIQSLEVDENALLFNNNNSQSLEGDQSERTTTHNMHTHN